MFILTVFCWFMLWNSNMIRGNVLMNVGGFLTGLGDCWLLCQTEAAYGPKPSARPLDMVAPIRAGSSAGYCSCMDLSRVKPVILRLCRPWLARFFSVLPLLLNESAAVGGQQWAAFF